jgi:hypothetical protein
MSQPRASLWAATEEIDEDLHVDVHLAIGNYGQNGLYDDGPYIHPQLLSLLSHHFPALQLSQESMKLPSLRYSTRWRNKQLLRRFQTRSSECVLPCEKQISPSNF